MIWGFSIQHGAMEFRPEGGKTFSATGRPNIIWGHNTIHYCNVAIPNKFIASKAPLIRARPQDYEFTNRLH